MKFSHKSILLSALLTASLQAADTNLVTNGSFAGDLSGWTTQAGPTPNNGTAGWALSSTDESNASNLSYTGLAAGVANPGAGAILDTNDTAPANASDQFDVISQSITGLQTTADRSMGNLDIWFDSMWTNAGGTTTKALSSVVYIYVGNTALLGLLTSPDVASTGASFTLFNGATLDTGTLGTGSTFSTNWAAGTWGRFKLTLPGFVGTDAATDLSFRFGTATSATADAGRDDMRIDNVLIVQPVPEPSGALLCVSAGMFFILRRRRF